MHRAFRIVAVVLICLPVSLPFTSQRAYAPLLDPCKSSVSASPGIALVCPAGDGDALSTIGCTVTVTVHDNADIGIAGIPKSDMWLLGCAQGLSLCGGVAGSYADRSTNALGQSTFSNEPIAGGCDTGLYVAVQGIVIQDHTTCQPQCLPVAVRSPDYKSAGAPGPAPCSGDLLCPDARVSMADYTWFASHYPTADNPGAPYFSCADFGAPFVPPISLNDYSRFVIHYAGAGHKCSL